MTSALRLGGRAGRLAVLRAVLLALIGIPLMAAPVRALPGENVFGDPSASFRFLSGISLSEPVNLPAGVTGIEAVVRTAGSDRVLTTPVPLPGPGSPVLRYTLDTPSGGLLPNTTVQLGFRLLFDGGRSEDGPLATVQYEDTRYEWRTITGSLVRIHWVTGGDAFGRKALQIAEQAVADAASLLGVSEHQPIDFYVYTDRSAFYDVLGPSARENVGAVAFPQIRTVFANIESTDPNDPTVSTYIPHELTHVVFGDATDNAYHQPLHWLNEGLAVYLSQGYDAGARGDVASAIDDHTLMPLTALSGQFPTQADRFGLAYDESVSAVDFLVRAYGRDALVKLITSYANGVSDDDAFRAGIGTDQAGFEAAWLADLHAPPPSPFGPQPAPAGPVPSDWAAAASAGPGTTAAPAPGPDQTPRGGFDTLLAYGGALLVVIAVGLIVLNAIGGRREPPPGDNPKPW